MQKALFRILYQIRSGFWFIPGLLVVFALAGATASVNFDETAAAHAISSWLPFPQTGIEGARQVVSTIAGSMITVASLVFSLTLIALTLMSQQLGPRILPIFMTDRTTQVMLGYFVATFVYSLIVLSTIGSGTKGEFIPHLSVYFTTLFAILAFGLMIYFVHHIARSIQADAVVAQLADSLDREIESNFASEQSNGRESTVAQQRADEAITPTRRVIAPTSGYVQLIDYAAAVRIASENDAYVRFECTPGHYVVKGESFAGIAGAELDEQGMERLNTAVTIGPQRTPAQQVEYEFNTLLEVAVRALSPGVNDPFTAITCIDHLVDALARIMNRPPIDPILYDDDGTPRVRRYLRTFEHYMRQVWHPLRQAAVSMPQVTHRLAHAMRTLYELCERVQSKETIVLHAQLIAIDCLREVRNENDREDILSILDGIVERPKA